MWGAGSPCQAAGHGVAGSHHRQSPACCRQGCRAPKYSFCCPSSTAHPCLRADLGDAPNQGSSLGASHSPPACPQVTVPISIPLQRAQAALQESKQARKRASQLATRANETQQELSRQKHVAEKLRGDLEEAHQVSRVPLGRLCPPEPGRGFAHSPKHRVQASFWAPLYGECLEDVPGIPSPLLSSQGSTVSLIWVSVCVGRWGHR